MLYRENIAHIAWGKLYSLDLFRNKPTINFSKFFSRKEYYEFNPVENSMYKFPVGILNEDLALIYFLIIEAGSIAQGTKKTYYYFSNPDSISRSRVKKKDFSVFSLYEFVSSVILDYYPDLDDAVLEFRNTIYVKLYKRIMLNQRNDYKDEQKFIKEQLKKSMARTIKSKIRRVTKIRSIVGGYANWIEVTDRTHDSSAVIALNLLKACGVKEVLLAGLDGFSVNINENYFDPNMRHPVNNEQVERRNHYYKNLIQRVKKSGIRVEFITPSKYEENA